MAGSSSYPQGRQTLTVGLVFRNCAKAIAFYKRALGAEEVMRMDAPDGKSVWHCELRIGNTLLFLGDEMPGATKPAPSAQDPAPLTLWLAAEDCDAAYRTALEAGATSTMEPADMFWGDRVCAVTDPFGYSWSFAEHQRDVSDEELRRAGEEFAQRFAATQPGAEANP